jgi:hypothetical protein
VLQRENKHSRSMTYRRRTGNRTRCSLLVIHEASRTWTLYPHSGIEFGVRLTQAHDNALTRAVRAGTTQ